MNTKRLILRLAAVAALVASAAACTVDQGDPRPQKTQGEIEVYRQICDMNDWAAYYGVFTAAGLNEYLRQTTDEGREAVRSRYFYGSWIRQTEEGHWLLESEEVRFEFVLEDDALLGEENASWRMSCWNWYLSLNEPVTGIFTTEGDRIRCKLSRTVTDRTEAVDWLAATTLAENDIRMEIEGSGRIDFTNKFWFVEDKWHLEYRVLEPQVREDFGRDVVTGKLAVTALATGTEPRSMEFVAEHLGLIDVEITVGNSSEKW